jgi:hypothetical protein
VNGALAALVLLEDAWREGLLRQAETQRDAGDAWTRAYWEPYVDADAQHLGAWRALLPGLVA